jgi:hypothetical protein
MFRCICIFVEIAELPAGATTVRKFSRHRLARALICTPVEITAFLTE